MPQEPRQATAATQPYPDRRRDRAAARSTSRREGFELVNGGRIFTPFWDEPDAVKPQATGRRELAAELLRPRDASAIRLRARRHQRVLSDGETTSMDAEARQALHGRRRSRAPACRARGIFAAVDVRTNKLAWRQQWREICYSGSVVTGGGLVFVGRNDGRLTALDKANGELLWEFMTDAGVNTTVTTFEHKGKQYVVVHAAGGVFAGTKRGDGIWMFSLDGKFRPTGGTPGETRRPRVSAGD